MCSNQSPFEVNGIGYGFAAVKLSGQTEADTCCSCYQLTFTNTAALGKTMIVQATNTGGDLGRNHFDLAIPGGGVGLFTRGCSNQLGGLALGRQYGGLSRSSDCNKLPSHMQAGCKFRWSYMAGADNPSIAFSRVKCPNELVSRTGCLRSDDSSYPAPSTGQQQRSAFEGGQIAQPDWSRELARVDRPRQTPRR